MPKIEVRGAREHNLAGVNLTLPRGRLIAFTGVSGSGKSSLAFDTLHAEGQRRYLEALSLQTRGVARGLSAPDVDWIEGLPPTIALDQRYRAPSPRVTVGTFTELHHVLAVLFGRAGVLHCPTCQTPIVPHTHDAIVEELAALPSGTRLTVEAPVVAEDPVAVLDEIAAAGFSRVRVGEQILRLDGLDRREVRGPVRVVVDRIRTGPGRVDRLHDAVRLASQAGQGVIVAGMGAEERVFTDRAYCLNCDRSLPALTPRLLSWEGEGACPTCSGTGRLDGEACSDCGGTRLSPAARSVRWAGHGFAALQALELPRLQEALGRAPTDPVSEVAVEELQRRIGQLRAVGLDHLSLGRGAASLSSGELQRVRLARQLGARLSGVLYVLDEPTAGLHRQVVRAVVELLEELVRQGNTVLVVEHDPEVVRAADRVVDFGPGAGVAGGRIVYEGDVQGLRDGETLTGRWLSGRETLPPRPPRALSRWVKLRGLRSANLQGIDLQLPLGALTAITGPSGSGKSAVLDALWLHLAAHLKRAAPPPPPVLGIEGLTGIERIVRVDRSSARAARSNPATYTGLWDVVRELLASTREAQVRGLKASHFSLNVKGGRCESCQGTGERRVDLELLADVYLVCPVCDGRRFTGDVLQVRWKGLAPDALLALPVAEAHPLLAGHPKLDRALRALVDVGLEYVPLGQPTHTLSGGEAHRLRLARELIRVAKGGAAGTVYLVDDPTVGLHPADIASLLGLFRRLVQEGGTLWLATHHEGMGAAADWEIALGPGAGPEGGQICAQGPPRGEP